MVFSEKPIIRSKIIETPINVQKKKDGTAKAYQVKQAIKIINGE